MPNRIVGYRCVSIVIEHDGHAIQNISYSMQDADHWSHVTADKYNCTVRIYISREFTLKNVKPTTVKEKREIEKEIEKENKRCLICGDRDCNKESHKSYQGRVK